MPPILDGTASDHGSYEPTPCERFRDLTGAHPAYWVAFVLACLLAAL